MQFLSNTNFNKFIGRLLRESKVIAPVEQLGKSDLQEISLENIAEIKLSGFRTIESFKPYFFKLTEKVSQYFGKEEALLSQKLTILGARGCDLEALEVLDRVFGEGDLHDPFYLSNREKIIIISADCSEVGETCFCNLVGGKPHPQKKFDLNLSPLEDGYLVETGSPLGEELTAKNKELFREVSKAALQEQVKLRTQMIDLLQEKNKNYSLKLDLLEIHKRNLENDRIWKVLTKDCVECSACNFICPTCSCFLLLDTPVAGRWSMVDGRRYKVWDACLKTGYAKVAGGANPRGKLYQRLQNRYQCKFDYSYDRLGRYSCVGCGRCIDGCAGKIDMRKIFVELEKQVPLTAKLT